MLKQALYGAAALVALTVAAFAQDSQMSRPQPLPPHQVEDPIRGAVVQSGPASPASAYDWRMFEWPLIASAEQVASGWLQWDVPGAPGYDLPTSIVSWLAENFGLPPIYRRPDIFVSIPTRLTALDYGDLAEATKGSSRIPATGFYDNAKRRVYVGAGWSPETAGGQSILVHQLVYHLQTLAGLKYECPQARARVAYDAQARWLSRTGRTLESEFGIDPETLLLSTECHIP